MTHDRLSFRPADRRDGFPGEPDAGAVSGLKTSRAISSNPSGRRTTRSSGAGPDGAVERGLGEVGIGPEAQRNQEIGPPEPHTVRHRGSAPGVAEHQHLGVLCRADRSAGPGALQAANWAEVARSAQAANACSRQRSALAGRNTAPLVAHQADTQGNRAGFPRAAAPRPAWAARSAPGERPPIVTDRHARMPAGARPSDTNARHAR